MPGAPRGHGEKGKPSAQLRGELTFTRRTALRVGLAGTAMLASDPLLRPLQAAAVAGTPVNTLVPGVYDFNADWLFGGVYTSGAEAPGQSEARFQPVTIPHTVTPLSWGDWDASEWEHIWVYRRHITYSATNGQRVFVDFDGVMTDARIYLNGTELGEHQGGYLPWSVELTEHLRTGDNVLAMVVDGRWLNVPPSGAHGGAAAVDYLQPAGIYRDVSLRVAPQVFLADVFAKPTNVLSGAPGVDVELTLDAAAVPAGPVSLSAALLDGTTELASAAGELTVPATGTTTATVSIPGVSGIGLWSPESPQLYQVTATIEADGVAHTLQVTTGFRQATFTTGGFYLNGSRYQIFGLNRHQLFPYMGMAAPERLQRRDAEIFKDELNCNMVRCSHYPQSPAFLDACDELGLMVWEEPPGWHYVGNDAFQDIVLQNVQDMVIRDRNRPSVIVWGTRLDETLGAESLYARTRQIAYTLDGTRQTSGAMSVRSTSGWSEDLFAYDDYHHDGDEAILDPPLPGVPYLVTEAVGSIDGPPFFRWVDSQDILAAQAQMHAQVHDIARSDPAYAGLLAWSGIDYASVHGPTHTWHNVKWPGVIDTFRVPKLGAAFYRSQVDPTVNPVILPVFFWDFGSASPAGGPGPGTMIATNCEMLEVYVAGQLLTVSTPVLMDFPNLAYPPAIIDLTVAGGPESLPELRIDGYVAGQLMASLRMSSDPALDQLSLSVDDASIQGDGTDATRLTFRVLDAYGNQRPYPAGDVDLALTGPATLLGDNPFPFATYGGVGGALIRSRPGASGTVLISATHPALGLATASLEVEGVAGPGASIAPSRPAPRLVNPVSASRVPDRTGVPPSRRGSPPVSKAAARAALAALLVPAPGDRRIARLLRHSGYEMSFDAPAAGKLVVKWYMTGHAGRQLVGRAEENVERRGPLRAKLGLTGAGHRRLEHARHERISVEAAFTPRGQSKVTLVRLIHLVR